MPITDTIPGSQARIFIDEFELTQQSSGAEFNATFDTISYPIMGSPAAHQQVAAPVYAIPHRGYYTGRGASDNLGYFEDTLRSRLGTTNPVTVTLILGPVAYTMFGTWGSQLTIDAPVEGLITVEGNWAAPNSVRRGLVIPAQDYLDLANSPEFDLGAAGVANAAAIHASGFADLTAGAEVVNVNIQTSATPGGAYTTWVSTLTPVSTPFKKPGAKIITAAANNPNRYVRVQVDFSTGVPGPVNVLASILYL